MRLLILLLAIGCSAHNDPVKPPSSCYRYKQANSQCVLGYEAFRCASPEQVNLLPQDTCSGTSEAGVACCIEGAVEPNCVVPGC